MPHYHPWFHAGMNSQQSMLLGSAPYQPNVAIPPYPFVPAQSSMMPPQPGRLPWPPLAAHVQHPMATSEPAQHHLATCTAPPL